MPSGCQLFLGDCLEILPTLPEKSLDLVLVDLPYQMTDCRWDSLLPLDFLWKEYYRLSRERAVWIFTASQPFTTTLINSNPKDFRYEWIWEKPQGTNPLNAKFQPLKSHENILVFYRKKPTYHPQMEKSTPYRSFLSETKTLGEAYSTPETPKKSQHRDNPEGTRYPKTVLRFPQERKWHPTQKPVDLMAYLIRTYTNPGERVLDHTMGSGTTGVAALREGREFIGIEKEEKYFRIAEERMAELQCP